jgi:predicted metal-dependent phosphoesterase TrpH
MTPLAIVETARARGLGLIALTDHNSVATVADLLEAARATSGFTAILGVENHDYSLTSSGEPEHPPLAAGVPG